MRAAGEQTVFVMLHVAHLSMHGKLAAHDASAECLADCLMTEADAEEWSGSGGDGADEIDATTGALRCARTG